MMFTFIFSFVVLQRIVEIIIAKENEKWMKAKGAIEFGKEHYPYIVLVHVFFLISFLFEVSYYEKTLSPLWPGLLAIFIFAQVLRYWCLYSLGRFWNTKILILPNVSVISNGPYKFIRHPNYIVVAIELLIIPLLFNAFLTATFFSILNAMLMTFRIPMEEKALKNNKNVTSTFINRHKLLTNRTSKS